MNRKPLNLRRPGLGRSRPGVERCRKVTQPVPAVRVVADTSGLPARRHIAAGTGCVTLLRAIAAVRFLKLDDPFPRPISHEGMR